MKPYNTNLPTKEGVRNAIIFLFEKLGITNYEVPYFNNDAKQLLFTLQLKVDRKRNASRKGTVNKKKKNKNNG